MLALTPDRSPFDAAEMPLQAMQAKTRAMRSGAGFWTRPRAWMAMLVWCGAFWAAAGYGIASILG